jgi:hypothetical protein
MAKKCEHNKGIYKCRICNPKAYCEHDKYKYSCDKCKPELKNKTKNKNRKYCEHEKRKDSCVDCSGCIHKKLICIECKPSHFCIHKRRKTVCKECKGGSICEHKKIRSACIKCEGGSLCEHKKRRSACVECGGVSICEHKKIKYFCTDCDGSQICIHKKIKKNCKDCEGTDYCEHKIQKYFCKDCNGKGICSHKIRRRDCKICNPEYHFINLQRGRTRYILKQLGKTHNTEHYLGCSPLEFYQYIKLKMTDDMTIDNIHLDHIKPVSKFDLTNIEEVYKCCHWSNFQPLLIKDNLIKNNKWSIEENENWEKNITKYNSNQRVSVDNI